MGEHSVLYYSADALSYIVSPGIFSPSLLFFFFSFLDPRVSHDL